MTLDRRGLLAGLGLAGLAAAATPAAAQTPTPAPRPGFAERLAAEAPKHRLAMDFDGQAWSGPGLDWLIAEGAAAQFFLLGEEHGIAQVPALVRQLLPALKAAGYSRLGLENSPPATKLLDLAALGGVEGLKRFYAESPPGPAFYTMSNEAEMLAAVRAAFPKDQPLLFGLDYEVTQDRLLIAALKAKAPASARAAVAALETASRDSWAQFETTRNPEFIFCFNGDPALVTAIRAAWPQPDPASAEILETLEQSLTINQHQTAGRYFQSNETRALFNRANWARLWRAETAAGREPKAFFKFGAGHMIRGRGPTEVYDIGNIVSETATLMGKRSFHLLVVPAAGGHQAAFNPSAFRYEDIVAETIDELGLAPLAAQALPGGSTLFDLRPLRPLMPGSVTQTADPRLTRVIHGFDAMLLVADSKASGNL
ncbi:MAG: hypothetical protein WC068_09770 [Caulobacter sp.]